MYKKKDKGWIKHFDFIILDLISVQIAFILAYYLRHGGFEAYDMALYRNMGFFFTFADIAVIYFNESYKNVLKRGYYKEFVSAAKHTSIVFILSALYLFSIKEAMNFSRVVLYTTWILYMMISYLIRILWKKILRKRILNQDKMSLLVVTTFNNARNVIDCIQKKNLGQHRVVGCVITDRDMTGEKIGDVPVVSNLAGISEYVCYEWVDEVFIYHSPNEHFPEEIVDELLETGTTLHMNLVETCNVKGKKQLIEKFGEYTVLTTSINYMTQKQAIFKRILDIIGGIAGCCLTCIVFVFVAPFIYISSPGPILFSQIRVGQNGKKFKLYKFRSMYMDAEERKKELMEQNRIKDGRMFKLDFDTRIIGNRITPSGEKKTGIGDFIRRTSLDEFPQFFNVLKGDMSLVGTRPPTVDEWEKYEKHHKVRLATKPGITGMWQVSGRSNITDFEEVVRLDKEYIDEWSIGLDIKILFKTLLQVLKKDGSM